MYVQFCMFPEIAEYTWKLQKICETAYGNLWGSCAVVHSPNMQRNFMIEQSWFVQACHSIFDGFQASRFTYEHIYNSVYSKIFWLHVQTRFLTRTSAPRGIHDMEAINTTYMACISIPAWSTLFETSSSEHGLVVVPLIWRLWARLFIVLLPSTHFEIINTSERSRGSSS